MPSSLPFRSAVLVVGRIACVLAMAISLAQGQQTRNVTVGSNFFRDSVSNNPTSTIKAGDTIHWVWTSGLHSTTSGSCPGGNCAPNGVWDSGIDSGITFDRTFNSVGTFPYYCVVHGAMMSGTVIVEAAAAAATTTVVTTSGSPSTAGQSVTFAATVTSGGGTPSGNVNFKDGEVDIAGSPVALNGQGVATLSTSALTAGSHSITANYAGNASFAASISADISQVVRINTSTGLQSSANPSTAAQPVTFTATVTNSGTVATGSISFRDNGVEIGTGTLNGSGVATFQTSALTQGTHPLTATYAGDDLHFGSTSATLNQVVHASLSPVNFQPTALAFGGVVLLRTSAPQTLTLTNGTGAPISTSSLQITGDYAQTNNCGVSLAAGANCTIAVTCTPQATGTRIGEVMLDGANTVALTCTGVEFALSLTRPRRPPRH